MSEQGENPNGEMPESGEKLGRLMALARAVPVLGYIAMEKMRPALKRGRDIINDNVIPALGRAGKKGVELFNSLHPQIKKTIPVGMVGLADAVVFNPTFPESLATACALGVAERLYISIDKANGRNDFSLHSFGSALNDGFGNNGTPESKELERIHRREAGYTALAFARPAGYLAASTALNVGARWSGVEEICNNNLPEIITLGTVLAGTYILKKRRDYKKRHKSD